MNGQAQEPAQESSREPTEALTETELAILAMEQSWSKYPGAKESAVRERFDMSLTRYYQVLNAVIDKPAALATDL